MTALMYDARDRLEETGARIAYAAEDAALRLGELLDAARDRARLLAAVGAVGLLLVTLVVVRGAGGGAPEAASAEPSAHVAAASTATAADVTFFEENGFSLSLPSGWTRTETPDGAVLAATSADGSAQTTLWVERDPELSFDGFVNESLAGLEALGGEARIADRTAGGTLETSSAELHSEIPVDGMAPGPYRVDLRAAGPYRYYLATSIEAGAPVGMLADAETIGASLRPEVSVRGLSPDG